jgi:hypothetical protein
VNRKAFPRFSTRAVAVELEELRDLSAILNGFPSVSDIRHWLKSRATSLMLRAERTESPRKLSKPCLEIREGGRSDFCITPLNDQRRV